MHGAHALPWFMFDLQNYQLLTSGTIPHGDISDTKSVIITETPIPGRNYQPVSPGGNGNRKVSFKLPVIRRNDYYGNILLLKQFERLRNQAGGFAGQTSRAYQFTPNPKVLYNWGLGTVPLVYFVTKCSFSHQADMVNLAGMPQYTTIDFELTLDEENVMYKSEQLFRDAASVLGMADAGIDVVMGAGAFVV